MPPEAILIPRRGGGGSSNGQGRSSSSSSSGTPTPKPAPAPKSASQAPPILKSPPAIAPPAFIPSHSNVKIPGQEKSGKKYPFLPKPPKGFKPKHHDQHDETSRDGYTGSSNALPKGPIVHGKDVGIAIGVIFGVILFAVLLCICCKGYRLRRAGAKTRTASSRRSHDLELGSQGPPEKPERPKRAFLKDGCVHCVTMLQRSIGCKTPLAKTKGTDEPSYLEEGLAAEKPDISGGNPSAQEKPVVGTTVGVDGKTGRNEPPI